MLSRVAENLFWMSRYIERAENLARLVTAHQNELLDATSSMTEEVHEWHPLLEVTAMGDEDSSEGVVTYMVSSEENPDSILNCVYQARENGRAVRDQISEEMWLEINALWLDIKSINPTLTDRHSKICELAIHSSMKFRGIVEATLPRTEVWVFVQLGAYLERADKTSRIVDLPYFLPKREKAAAWNTILRACSATAEYRNRYGGEVDSSSASTLLLFSTTFPRSVRFCAKRIDDLLHGISGTAVGDYSNEAEQSAGSFLARMNFCGVEEIGELSLHGYVDSIQVDLNKIGLEIGMRYFLLRKDAPPKSAEEYVKSRMEAQESMKRKQGQQQTQKQ